MANLDLRIALDDPYATYELGDPVSGTLHIAARKEADFRGLLVRPAFAVEGTYNPAVGGQPEPVDVMVGGGHAEAGSSREVPFTVELPLEPPPYEGQNFRLFWRIEARVDLPLALDVKAEPMPIDVRVGKATREGEYTGHHMSGEAPDLGLMERSDDVGAGIRRGCGPTFVFLLSLALAVPGLGALVVFLPAVGSDPINWLGVLIGLGLLVPSVFLFRRIRRKSVTGAVGTIEIEANPQIIRPGETMTCHVVLTPVRDLTLESVALSLVEQEFYTVARERTPREATRITDSRVKAETLHTDRRLLARQVAVSKGTRADWEAAFQLSEAVPYSIRTSTAGVRWLLRAEIEAEGARTAVKEKPVVVRP